jgi:hypothetical protein
MAGGRDLGGGLTAVPVPCVRRTAWFMNHARRVPLASDEPEPWSGEWPGYELLLDGRPAGAAAQLRHRCRPPGTDWGPPWPWDGFAPPVHTEGQAREWTAFDLTELYEGSRLRAVAVLLRDAEANKERAEQELADAVELPLGTPNRDFIVRTALFRLHGIAAYRMAIPKPPVLDEADTLALESVCPRPR